MTSLDDILGVEDTPSQRLATALVDSDVQLIRTLIELRKHRELSQKDIADALGLTQPTIAAFERYDNDPRLSTVRRYAHAVGAYVQHMVEEDRGQELRTSGWAGRDSLGATSAFTTESKLDAVAMAVGARGGFALAA